jgi:hypothetical protein
LKAPAILIPGSIRRENRCNFSNTSPLEERLPRFFYLSQAALIKTGDEAAVRDWLKTGFARINDAMQGLLMTQ